MDAEGDTPASAATRCGASRKWSNMKTFTALASLGQQTHVLIFSVQMSALTTIQKLYGLSTFQTGVLFSIYEVGEITAGVLVSYFASRSKKPRVIAAGMLLMAVACLMFAAPHFALPSAYSDGGGSDAQDHLYTASACVLAGTPSPHQPNFTPSATGIEPRPESACGDARGEGQHTVTVMILYSVANVILGVGYSPIASLTVVFIDDNSSSKSKASFYQSVFYMVNYFGYALGYGIAAGLLSIHSSLNDVPFSQNDPRWLGAWWLGFVLCAVMELSLSAMMFFFPASLAKPEKYGLPEDSPPAVGHCSSESSTNVVLSHGNLEDEDELTMEGNGGDSLPSPKEFLPTLWEFITNPLYILPVLTRGCLTFVDAGFFAYLPKYLETQFHQTAALADLETGLCGSLVSTFTVLAGGWAISKYKPTVKQCTIMTFASYLAGSALFAVSTFIFCPQQMTDRAMVHDSRYVCISSDYYPVCINETTYYSPCHAGCQNVSSGEGDTVVFTGCLCSDFGNDTISGAAGVCRDDCNSLLYYLITVTIAYAAPTVSAMATVTVLLRCVKRDHRSFCLGIYNGSLSILAWLPSPMIYGALIDMTCVTWGKGSGSCRDTGEQGSCSQYDNSEFRLRMHGLTFGSLSTGAALAAATWVVAHAKEKRLMLRKKQAAASLSALGSGVGLVTE